MISYCCRKRKLYQHLQDLVKLYVCPSKKNCIQKSEGKISITIDAKIPFLRFSTSNLLTLGPFDAATDVPRRETSDSKASQFVKRYFVKRNNDTITTTIVFWKGKMEYNKKKVEESNEEDENVSS
jgi:hypothetical protein